MKRSRWDNLTLQDRFWANVNKNGENGCWEWTASKSGNGYGQIRAGKTNQSPAHRVSYELTYGKIPDGAEIDHICHNKGCVNPCHLRIASRAENMRNSARKKNNIIGLKGVSWHSTTKKWFARICFNRKLFWLGCFDTPEDAHKAYCEAAIKLHGEFANFG